MQVQINAPHEPVTNAFAEHIGLIGGFVLVALLDRRERVA